MMDRALKERVIGAAVLVVFAVLLVPVFLDGPSNDAVNVQESIILPGQEAQAADQKTIVLEREREQPVPAPRAAEKELVQAAPVVVSQPPPKKPDSGVSSTPPKKLDSGTTAAPPPKPANRDTPAASTTGMWAVQLGSFSNQANAERLASDLRKDGYAAFLSQLQNGSKQLHRVRIGPQKDRATAETVAAKLKAAGHTGQVVPHP